MYKYNRYILPRNSDLQGTIQLALGQLKVGGALLPGEVDSSEEDIVDEGDIELSVQSVDDELDVVFGKSSLVQIFGLETFRQLLLVQQIVQIFIASLERQNEQFVKTTPFQTVHVIVPVQVASQKYVLYLP